MAQREIATGYWSENAEAIIWDERTLKYGAWAYRRGGKEFGPFASELEALAAVNRAAEEALEG